MKRIFLLLVCALATVLQAFAQTCTINISKQKVCLGNPVSFSPNISGGGVITDYTWNFGNSVTNKQSAVVYQYPAAGIFTPTLTVTFSNGTTCSATGQPIEVLALPQSAFSFVTIPTQCFNGNNLCIKNLSVPGASGAPVDTANLYWDDGTRIYFQPFSGQVLCHTYTDPFGGIYTPVLEVTDRNGCIARLSKKDSITVFSKMRDIRFEVAYTLSCPQTPAKFTNKTAIPRSQVKHFTWLFGDGQTDSASWDSITHIYTAAGIFDARLIVTDLNNCTDSFVLLHAAQNVHIDPLIHITPDDHSCYRKNDFSFLSNNPAGFIRWELFDENNLKIATDQNNYLFKNSDITFANCGVFRMRMYVDYLGSTCSSVTDTIIHVYGPNAIAQSDTPVTNRIIGQVQCQIHDTVKFRSPVPFQHCLSGNTVMNTLWDFGDNYMGAPYLAEACTTDTKNNINVGRNCRWSKDSMNVWHAYTPGKEDCYKVTVYMEDPVRGCWDGDTVFMKLRKPSAHADSTVVPIRRGVYYTLISNLPCVGDPIGFHFDDILPQCGFDSAWFMPDSSCPGAFWRPVDRNSRKLTYVYNAPCSKDGWVTYGAVVRNGEDNNSQTCYDTAWYRFKMLEIKPEFTYKVHGTCPPYEIEFALADSIQDSIVSASWEFETYTSNLNLHYQFITHSGSAMQNLASTDSVIHGQTYISPSMGFVHVLLSLTNTRQCQLSYVVSIPLGFEKQLSCSRDSVCVGDTISLRDFIRYYPSQRLYWEEPARALAGLEKIWIDKGDGSGFTEMPHNAVISYNRAGTFPLRMVMQDSLGCRDTIPLDFFPDDVNRQEANVYVSAVDAAIQVFDSIQTCAPFFLNLFDSSTVQGPDVIDSWDWSFTDNKPHSSIQHPQHDFTSNGPFTIRLAVTTHIGCMDTVSRNIHIQGPIPQFDIMGGQVGCVPFTVRLKNGTSQQLTGWQWTFNDSGHTILSTTMDTNIVFTYDKPGVYHIVLLGTDTIRDPATHALKTCTAFFPDPATGLPPRTVTVLPRASVKITGPDNICPNEIDTFIARGDSAYSKYGWGFSDGSTLVTTDTMLLRAFIRGGIYNMYVVPASTTPGTCIDTGYKTVNVKDITADFVIDDTQLPLYKFTNSSVNAVSYSWFTGSDYNNQFSTEANPVKTILDTGAVLVCLKALNSEGCWDTTCKEVKAKVRLIIPNVFTPDNNDGKNDAFDIDIVGWTKYDLSIYNRWGTLVYKSDKDGIGNDGVNWNGKNMNEGAQCSSGVYYFMFKYKLSNDTSEQVLHGTITLIRPEN